MVIDLDFVVLVDKLEAIKLGLLDFIVFVNIELLDFSPSISIIETNHTEIFFENNTLK